MRSETPAWPTSDTDPLRPYADQDRSEVLGWDDHRAAGGTLHREVYDTLASRYLALLDHVTDGVRPLDAGARAELEQLCTALRISTRLTHDRRTERPPPAWIPSDADLARVTADMCPAAAVEATDRVLGPLADELDARRPAHALALRVALASYAFVIADGELDPSGAHLDAGQTPFEQWTRRKPLPTVEERAAFRAVERAPWTAWVLQHHQADGRWTVEELIGVSPRGVPDGPVRVPDPAAPWRPPRPGDTLLARIVEGPDGWEARTPLVIPGGPPKARLHSWVRLELMRHRVRQRTLTVDALLRRRGFVLARHLCEWAWLHGDDDPYADPDLYDLEYRDHDEDLGWYVDLARGSGGPVLELGCGTGRLTLAIARAGVRVHGIDLSPTMLAGLERKLAAEPVEVRARVTTSLGDFRTFEATGQAPLVIVPFNALHHCRTHDELVALFSRARQALAPGGRFAFDCYLPDLDLYDRDPDTRYEERTFVDPRTGERLVSWEQGWWDAEARVHHVVYVYQHDDGREERSHLQLRMYERDELRAALAAAGLRVVSEASDFRGQPVDDDALKLVVVTRPR